MEIKIKNCGGRSVNVESLKEGQKLEVVDSGNSRIPNGMIVEYVRKSDESCIFVKLPDTTIDSWYVTRFVVLEGQEGKPKKIKAIKPFVKHLVLKDSCNNTIKTGISFEEASKLIPEVGASYTIYKMVPVATIISQTVTRVKKVK